MMLLSDLFNLSECLGRKKNKWWSLEVAVTYHVQTRLKKNELKLENMFYIIIIAVIIVKYKAINTKKVWVELDGQQ